MKILISGLTAAGKTTHARRLARSLALPYFSASQILAELLGKSGPWSPAVDAERAGRDVDSEVDRRILRIFDSSSAGVFDAWALPWLTAAPALRVWIDSDLPSRVRKAVVTELRRGHAPEYAAVEQMVLHKDAFSRQQFMRYHEFDLFTDREIFDATVDNSDYIPEASIAASDAGIQSFETVLMEKLSPYLIGS